jgi:hypothetical protein
LNLRLAATIATVLIVALGLIIISPLFIQPAAPETKQKVMLCFDIAEGNNLPEWTSNLASILNEKSLPATVFVLGKIAQENPQTVLAFNSKVDVGCKTYDNVNISTVEDYSLRLLQVKEGKTAVDSAGNLKTAAFRGNVGINDQDIFSLLSRNDVFADFSFSDHYNVYENNQFVRYNAQVFEANRYSADYFLSRTKTSEPVIIIFDSNTSIQSIDAFLLKLQTGDFQFVNASELTGLSLTVRGAS